MKRVSTRLAQKAVILPPPPPPITHQDEDEDVEIYDDIDELEDEEEYDSEAEAHAEALARQMHDQLAAEIGKVYHFKDDGTTDEIIPTIRHLLGMASADPRVHSMLAETTLADADQSSILDLLSEYLNSGSIGAQYTLALSQALLGLLSTPILEELEPTHVTGKRKRDQDHSPRPSPAAFVPLISTIESRIRAAADTVYWELMARLEPSETGRLSSNVKSQLGQIYHFTTTYADAADSSTSGILREISRLIKGTDILDRDQLAYPPSVPVETSSTAVFPCYRHPCNKLFSSPATLNAHTRTHASPNPNSKPSPIMPPKPKITPTLHYQCDACKDMFSRFDGWKHHQENSGRPACTDATYSIRPMEEIIIDPLAALSSWREEGELDPDMLLRAQDAVVRLQGPLKERAERARAVAAKMQVQSDEPELDELGTEIHRKSSSEVPVLREEEKPQENLEEVEKQEDLDVTTAEQEEENARLEAAMMKMVEDAQAEAEAEMMLESDEDIDVDGYDDE